MMRGIFALNNVQCLMNKVIVVAMRVAIRLRD